MAICLGRIWQNFDSARWCGVRDSAHEKLYSLLSDPIPEVLKVCLSVLFSTRYFLYVLHLKITLTRQFVLVFHCQVRCAAVFALGTFVGNSAERTDHSTTIDHNVAMMLAQLINDGSPIVRKVGHNFILVTALTFNCSDLCWHMLCGISLILLYTCLFVLFVS